MLRCSLTSIVQKSKVRPYLWYATSVCNSLFKKDAQALENTQRRCTITIAGLLRTNHTVRDCRFWVYQHCPTAEESRRYDTGFSYAFTQALNYDTTQFFELQSVSKTRGHRFKIFKSKSRLRVRN